MNPWSRIFSWFPSEQAPILTRQLAMSSSRRQTRARPQCASQPMRVPMATTAWVQEVERCGMSKPGSATKAGFASNIPSLLTNRMFGRPGRIRRQGCRTLAGNVALAARRLAMNALGVTEEDIVGRRVNGIRTPLYIVIPAQGGTLRFLKTLDAGLRRCDKNQIVRSAHTEERTHVFLCFWRAYVYC